MIRNIAIPLILITSSLQGHGKIGVEKVATGFERPVWAGMPAGSRGKLWVMEQAGRVWIVDLASGKRADEPFLDISKDVSRKGNEEGLLGLAFAPDFLKTGRYYVNFTDKDQHTRIVRFTAGKPDTNRSSLGRSADSLQTAIPESQRRVDLLRPGRHALHRKRRRRLRQ